MEKLNRCLLEDAQDAEMLNYMRGLFATQENSLDVVQRKALQMQCRTIFASRSQSVWTHANENYRELAYQLYAFAFEDEIRSGKWPNEFEPGFDPAQLQWMRDEAQHKQQVTWLVVQTNDQGQFTLLQQDQLAETASIVAPIASLQAQAQIPPVLTLPSGQSVPVRHAMPVNASEGAVELQTPWQHLQLTATEKPAWAHAMQWDSGRLYTSMAVAGKWRQFIWTEDQQAGEKAAVFRWVNTDPQDGTQFDRTGLYFDWVINDVTQRFRWIDPGTFWMGSPETEAQRYDSEDRHQVTLSKGFWLADTACTQALWQAVKGKNPANFKEKGNNPVEQVSWNDVQRFIQIITSQHVGLPLRLPTEVEWEYACRAGTNTPFSFGDNIMAEQVNFDGNYPYAGGSKSQYRRKTVAVKSLLANDWGLYEMHGNVWEWCADEWQEHLGTQPQHDPWLQAEHDPWLPVEKTDAGGRRVVRGGSWFSFGRNVRSAIRDRVEPDDRNYGLGFRLALGHIERGQAGHYGQALRDEVSDHNEKRSEQGLYARLIRKLTKK